MLRILIYSSELKRFTFMVGDGMVLRLLLQENYIVKVQHKPKMSEGELCQITNGTRHPHAIHILSSPLRSRVPNLGIITPSGVV